MNNKTGDLYVTGITEKKEIKVCAEVLLRSQYQLIYYYMPVIEIPRSRPNK